MRTTIAATAAMLLASAAIASEGDAPAWHHQTGLTTYLRTSTKPIALTAGVHRIGKPRLFACKSSGGCMVSVSASLTASGIAAGACIEMDGAAVTGACWPTFFSDAVGKLVVSMFGVSKVAAGEHAITMMVRVQAPQSATLTGLAEEYRIYERRVRGTN